MHGRARRAGSASYLCCGYGARCDLFARRMRRKRHVVPPCSVDNGLSVTQLHRPSRDQRRHLPERRNLRLGHADDLLARIRVWRHGMRDGLRFGELHERVLLRPKPALPAAKNGWWGLPRNSGMPEWAHLPGRRLLSVGFLPNLHELRKRRHVQRDGYERSRCHRHHL